MLVVAELPVRAWMRQRALDVGLATQSWPDWAADVLKAAGIRAVTAAIGGLVAVALIGAFRGIGGRRRRFWWSPTGW